MVDEDLIDREAAFAQEKILLAPQNQSPWNYLKGLYRKAGRPVTELRAFVEQFATSHRDDNDNGDDDEEAEEEEAEEEEAEEEEADAQAEVELGLEEGVRSSHALDLLADIYAEMGEQEKARNVLEVLGRKWDPVRKGYWDYRAGLLVDDNEEEKKERGRREFPGEGQGVAVA